MGWQIEIKNDKYRIWSSVVDDFITDWGTREEIMEVISERYRKKADDRIKELEATFPNGWCPLHSWQKRIHDERYMTQEEYGEHMWKKLKKEK